MPDDLDRTKKALRAEIREQRQRTTDPWRENAAQGIRAQLDALVAQLGAASLSCYLSAPAEPGTRPFLDAALARGIRVLLPITRGDGLLD